MSKASHEFKKRILIADDTASSRDLMRSILEGCGYEIAEASDGRQVLEKVDDFWPHLVILDLQMPQISGCAAAAALRKSHNFCRTPIVALTATFTYTMTEELTKAGFSAYLVKPIRPAQLRQCLEKLLSAD